MTLATQSEATIVIEVGAGDSIPSGAVIARVVGGSIPGHDIRRAFLLGTERTMEQDTKFALRLLAGVAIKALSPAINDPTTAVQALDQIEDLLLRIGVRTLDIGRLVGVRGTRVVYPAPTWDDLIALGLDEIRIYGAGSLQVMPRLRNLLQNLEAVVPAGASRRGRGSSSTPRRGLRSGPPCHGSHRRQDPRPTGTRALARRVGHACRAQ